MEGLNTLTGDLGALGLCPGMTVLLNASLGSLGYVEGGAAAVVAAIRDVLGPYGTLVSPATTEENSDTSRAYRARVANMTPEHAVAFRAAMPSFDSVTTPTSCGRIAEQIRITPGAIRSEHPQSSFSAIGPRAGELMADHRLDCHLGEASPLGKLYADRAWVLLLGVGYRSCTALHLAEYRYCQEPPLRTYRCVIRGQGWQEFTDVVLDDSDFECIGEQLDKTTVRAQGYVGQALCRLIPMRDVVDAAAHWMTSNRTFIVLPLAKLSGRGAGCPDRMLVAPIMPRRTSSLAMHIHRATTSWTRPIRTPG
jgi:aminoglycoside 3-N-acetyltransferase